MKQAKKSVSFRLSDDTIRGLATLANRHKISQADVIAVLVLHANTGEDTEQLDEMFELAGRLG